MAKIKLFLISLRYKSKRFYFLIGGISTLLIILFITLSINHQKVPDGKQMSTKITTEVIVKELNALYEVRYDEKSYKMDLYKDGKRQKTLLTVQHTANHPLSMPKASKEGYKTNMNLYGKWFSQKQVIQKSQPQESMDYLEYLQKVQHLSIISSAHTSKFYEVYLKPNTQEPQSTKDSPNKPDSINKSVSPTTGLYRVIILQDQILFGKTVIQEPPSIKDYLKDWKYLN